MKITYVGGHWHTNIGNSFYNLGALSLLKAALPEHDISFMPDPPQELWISVNNDYRLYDYIDTDLFILCGPSFNLALKSVYKKTFDLLKERGKKIAFLSVGASAYSEEEADEVSEFLSAYDILFVTTRDSYTFNLYANKLKTNIYDGICTSMYLNDCVTPQSLIDDYVVFNFSFWHEPYIEKVENEIAVKKQLFFKRQSSFDGKKIVRTNNSAFFPAKKVMYNRSNGYWSDLPYGYISILSSAHQVFSDRVHTCCAALINGVPAMYIKGAKRSHDGRNLLFERLGVSDIYLKPVMLDFDYIEREKLKMKDFIRSCL